MKFRKYNNQNGFTLIELLAVITILAIIMLFAAQSVTSALNKAQRRAFIIDAERIVEAAKLAYTDALLENKTKGSTTFCMDIDYLKNHGMEKNGEISGSILVDVSQPTAKYRIYLDNGQLQINGAYLHELSDEDLIPASSSGADMTCGNTGTVLPD